MVFGQGMNASGLEFFSRVEICLEARQRNVDRMAFF